MPNKKNWRQSSKRDGQIRAPIDYGANWEQVSSDALAWNNFISGLGIRMQHWSFIPDVFGAVDVGVLRKYDSNLIVSNNPNMFIDNNGIYKYEGDVYVIFQNNNKNHVTMPAGYFPDSTAIVTVNRHYIDTTKIVGLSEFDKLIPVVNGDPLEYASVNWEKINHNPSGYDRLMFKAVKIEHIIDASGVEYEFNVDYTLENGYVKWLPQGKRPGFDNNSSHGVVYAIRYRYIPSFYIKYAAHELRSHATIDPVTGEVKPIRGPMTAAIQIDWVFLQSLSGVQNSNVNIEYLARLAPDGGNTGPR